MTMTGPTSPITKRRHARTPALTQGSVSGSTSSFTSFATAGRGSLSQTLHLDPMAVHDADSVLEKMKVREAMSWESQIRCTHTALSTSLRTLVSERYRDMLQTANTIIDMGASSAALSAHLSSVLAATERACQVGPAALKREAEPQRIGQDQGEKEQLALTVSLRLVQEAPAALWEAVAPTSKDNTTALATATAATKEPGPAPGAMLRAAWICCAAAQAWESLEAEKFNVAKLFPYVASQYASLSQLRERITLLATQGLTNASYAATTTLLLAIALLQSLDAPSLLARFLDARLINLTALLNTTSQAPAEALGAALRVYSTTLLQAQRAFLCASAQGVEPYLVELLEALLEPDASAISDPTLEANVSPTTAKSSAARRKSSYGFPVSVRKRFPPTAYAALQTLPSGSLASHLPKSVKGMRPTLPVPHLQRATVQEALSAWTNKVHTTWSALNLNPLVGRLTSLRSLGAAQVTVRAALDSALQHAVRLGDEGNVVVRQATTFADALLKAVHERMQAVQSVRAGDMVSGLEHSTRSALERLEDQEASLLAFLLEPSHHSRHSDSDSSTSTLSAQLALRTPSLDVVLAAVERLAASSGSDAVAYERRVTRHARNVVRRAKDAQRGRAERDADIASMRALQTNVVQSACADLAAKLDAILEQAIRAAEETAPHVQNGNDVTKVRPTQKALRARVVFIGRIACGLARSQELQKALWPELSLAEPSQAKPAALQQLCTDLFKLRTRSLHDWQVRTAHAAVQLGVSSPRRTDGPSPGLEYALIVLSDALHEVGLAYSGEEDIVRGLLDAFVAAWLSEPSNASATDVGTAYDLELLRALQRLTGAEKEDEILERQRLTLRSSSALPEDFARTAEHAVHQRLSKLKLQLAPILIQHASYTEKEAVKATASSAPAPATPLIALAQSNAFFEPLPVIRAK